MAGNRAAFSLPPWVAEAHRDIGSPELGASLFCVELSASQALAGSLSAALAGYVGGSRSRR